jgi:tRNA U38,U39,U40 pseudouridine synthase TruA
MVRRIVAALLAAGKGTLDVSAVPGLLTAGKPALGGASAPARGLCLRRVVLGRRSGDEASRSVEPSETKDTGHED